MWIEADVEHSCGHAVRQKVHARANGEVSAKQLASQQARPCHDCRQRLGRKAWVPQNRADAAANLTAGMPQLDGSVAQILWAESIRRQWRERCDRLMRSLAAAAESGSTDSVVCWGVRMVCSAWAVTDAGWWIEHREDGDVALAIEAHLDALRCTLNDVAGDISRRRAELEKGG